MPIQDAQSIVRAVSDGTLAPATSPSMWTLDLKATVLKGLGLCINVGTLTTGTGTLKVEIFGSASTPVVSTDALIAARDGMRESATYIVPFSTKFRYVGFNLEAVATGTPTFTTVEAWITEPLGQDWTRAVEWQAT